MNYLRVFGPRIVLLLVVILRFLLQPVQAQTVLLCGNEGTGSHEFGKELVRLWLHYGHLEKQQLLVHPVSDALERLKRLEARQGELAVIDARTAYYMGKNLQLRVVAVLWPNWLHVVVNQHALSQPSLKLARTVLVHPNAIQAAQVWQSRVPEGELVWLEQRHKSISIEGLAEDAMLLAAPTPVEELQSLLELFETHILASLDEEISKEIRQQAPWWLKWKLKKNTYPSQNKPLTSIASFSMLVSRVDFPDNKVKRLLELIYIQKNRMNPHILFRNLNAKHNRLFRKTFNFHPRSRIFLGFK